MRKKLIFDMKARKHLSLHFLMITLDSPSIYHSPTSICYLDPCRSCDWRWWANVESDSIWERSIDQLIQNQISRRSLWSQLRSTAGASSGKYHNSPTRNRDCPIRFYGYRGRHRPSPELSSNRICRTCISGAPHRTWAVSNTTRTRRWDFSEKASEREIQIQRAARIHRRRWNYWRRYEYIAKASRLLSTFFHCCQRAGVGRYTSRDGFKEWELFTFQRNISRPRGCFRCCSYVCFRDDAIYRCVLFCQSGWHLRDVDSIQQLITTDVRLEMHISVHSPSSRYDLSRLTGCPHRRPVPINRIYPV